MYGGQIKKQNIIFDKNSLLDMEQTKEYKEKEEFISL